MIKNLEKIELSDSIADRIEYIPPDMNYPYFDHGKKIYINHRKIDFCLVNAWFLSESVFLSYNHPGFVKYAFYHAGFDSVKSFFGKTTARCFVAENRKAVIVVFRGTEINSLRLLPGAFADLNIAMADELHEDEVHADASGPRQALRVHSGFKRVLDEIWDGEGMLKEYLSAIRQKNPTAKIFVAGHSLGGALALIAASRFKETDCVYTFGCPRAGNREFVDSISAPVYRVVNNNDAVTMLPPKRIIKHFEDEEYCHAGELRFIDRGGNIGKKIKNKIRLGTSKEKESLFISGLDKVINQLTDKLKIDFIDHAPYLYAAKLWNSYVDSLK